MADKTNGEKVKSALESAIHSQGRQLSVALVGNNNNFTNVFHVLGADALKLAKPFKSKDPGAASAAFAAVATAAAAAAVVVAAVAAGDITAAAIPGVAAKDKDQDKIKPVNMIIDKNSGLKYLVDPLPSVVISITGDAQDMPEDDDFIAAVEDLVEKVKGGSLELNREAASRAISNMTAYGKNSIEKAAEVVIVDKEQPQVKAFLEREKAAGSRSSMCMQISLLLQLRMQKLEAMKDSPCTDSKQMTYTLGVIFKDDPSVRDVMLNVFKETQALFKDLAECWFSEHAGTTKVKPVVTSKRLPKAM